MLGAFLSVLFVWTAYGFLRELGAARSIASPSLPIAACCLVIGVVANLIIHEGGHRLAGAAMGWRCVRFGFGPYEFRRTRKGWKQERVPMLWGAFVRQMPPSLIRFRQEKATTLLCGPLASLIGGLLFAALTLASSEPVLFGLFGRIAIVTALGVFELVPRESKGIGSDGYRLWQVMRGGQGVEVMIWESLAEASNFTRLRFRDWPHDLIEKWAAHENPFAMYLAYLHFMDIGDLKTAAGHIRRLIATLPAENPYCYYAYEAAYWLAVHGGDPASARQWLERAGHKGEPEARLQAAAAVAWAEGDFSRAECMIAEALGWMQSGQPNGADQFEIDRLRYVSDRMKIAHATAAR